MSTLQLKHLSLNSKVLSETHKPFFSFVFQKKKRRSCHFTLKLTKIVFEQIDAHIPGTLQVSSARQLTCVFIRNSWFQMDSPFAACFCLPVTSRCARKQSANFRSIMCCVTQATCLPLGSYLIFLSLSSSCVIIKAELWLICLNWTFPLFCIPH